MIDRGAVVTEHNHAEVMLGIYRAQLSIVIQTERALVEMGLLDKNERRVLSRDERRQLTQNTT